MANGPEIEITSVCAKSFYFRDSELKKSKKHKRNNYLKKIAICLGDTRKILKKINDLQGKNERSDQIAILKTEFGQL